MSNHLRSGLERYFNPIQQKRLQSCRVGIAGAGGLGSNAAMLLARSGIENMRLIDHDIVEASNLNRQQFWPRQIGMPKVEALSQNLTELNPYIKLDKKNLRIHKDNVSALLADYPFWVEAFDNAQDKALFVEQALLNGCFVVSASGLCGIGGQAMQKRQIGNLVLVGDFSTGLEKEFPYAPRVTQAAAMMADALMERILESC